MFAVDDRLYAYSNNTLLWSKSILGTGLYPPSVADINGDGKPEIVFGTINTGRVYVLDQNGNDLSGWPVSFISHWILTAPSLADLDGDGQREIIVTELDGSVGNLHILKNDGTPFNNNWPVALTNRPATTPSVGDIDNDGEKDIIIHSTRTLYAFNQNAENKSGFPIVNPNTWFSFQSSILVDLDDDGTLEIIGASHGDQPEYYIFNHDGTYRSGWPQSVPDNEWTFSTPSVINNNDNDYQILMSRRNFSGLGGMMYSWDKDANMQNGFPIMKEGGAEGIISVADVDGDGAAEVVFGSNMLGPEGNGFVHAYKMDGSGEVSGFPVRPRGWTLMNGATIGDINGDNVMDMLVLSYTQNFGQATDSIYVNAYDLGTSYDESSVWWTGYKGSNSREGLFPPSFPVNVENYVDKVDEMAISIVPNPVIRDLSLEIEIVENTTLNLQISTILGEKIGTNRKINLSEGKNSFTIPTQNLESGVYLLSIKTEHNLVLQTKKFIKI